jgi:hypothetical protein
MMWMGCAGTPTRESTGEYIDDSVITAKVKAEYAGDPVVKATEVSVETFKGVVQLSGFVDNNDAKAKAEQLAKGVRGVVRVENNIITKPVAGAGGKSASADLYDYTGEITAINGDNSFTVKKALINHTFQLAVGADIVGRDGSKTRFSELHVGDDVKVFYMEQNGVKTATRVEVTGD